MGKVSVAAANRMLCRCPFCRSKVILIEHEHAVPYFVEIVHTKDKGDKEKCVTGTYSSIEKAITTWNDIPRNIHRVIYHERYKRLRRNRILENPNDENMSCMQED